MEREEASGCVTRHLLPAFPLPSPADFSSLSCSMTISSVARRDKNLAMQVMGVDRARDRAQTATGNCRVWVLVSYAIPRCRNNRVPIARRRTGEQLSQDQTNMRYVNP